ncbi:MAG: class I SAM-dependent methyltransferase [bacterium]
MSGDGLAHRLRRRLLPSFDLMLLERCRLLRCVEPGSRVLDAGCGDGTMAFRLARRGCRVVGVTYDAEAVATLRQRRDREGFGPDQLDVQVHDLREGTPPGGPYDAALCFDVLEHLLDDRGALGHVAEAVRDGGRVLITVPDRSAPPLWGDTVSAVEDGGHVRAGYTREELEALVRGAGLRPVRWRGFGGFVAQTATNVSRRLERRAGRPWLWLRFLSLAALRPLCRLDPLVPHPACGLFCRAHKP